MREKNNGNVAGGPMYDVKNGLKNKKFFGAFLFSSFLFKIGGCFLDTLEFLFYFPAIFS